MTGIKPSIAAAVRILSMTALRRLSLSILLLGFIATVGVAQTTSTTDATTPAGLAAGAPSGSYELSGFESVNLYNGNLNFHLPLVHVGGRGSAGYTMMLTLDSKGWRTRHTTIQNGTIEQFTPTQVNWGAVSPGLSPGVLQGRQTGTGSPWPCGSGTSTYPYTLTRLTFTAADGTEYELRDQNTNGQPQAVALHCPSSTIGASRGTVFVASDGTSATFISDATIYDNPWVSRMGSHILSPSGYLIMRDGTRYRIDNGLVSWIRDRNGNKLTFAYDPVNSQLMTITDSLNRQISISYPDGVSTFYTQISFNGFGGTPRTIRINGTDLSNALRPGYSIQTMHALFPELNGASTSTTFTTNVISSVVLPDGVQQYQFQYNSYGELARVQLPTGGAIEYDMTAGSGVLSAFGNDGYNVYEIFRRVVERRVYSNGSTLEGKTTYIQSGGGVVDPLGLVGASKSNVAVDHLDSSGARLARERHYFYATPSDSLYLQPQGQLYNDWKDGKEYETDALDVNGTTILGRKVDTWQQRADVWWVASQPQYGNPANDPRIIETDSTLVDSNQVAKQTYSYDQFNNKTDEYDYDYGAAGAAGALVRRTHTDYVTTNPANNADYTGNSIHIKSLPSQQQVFDAAGNEKARTTYDYDNYVADGSHAPLTDRSSISGLDAAFTTGYQTRGNATRVTHWILSTGSQLSSYPQYDIAGNVVKTIDARGNATIFNFNDNFGSPDGEARTNSAPTPLSSQSQQTYALVTKVTNALGHTSYSQYDYYTGHAVDGEDANGSVASGYYNDVLDRPTQVVRAANGGATVKSQTTFSYDDANRTIMTTSDQTNFNDNLLKSQMLYDGLGRTTETRQYETNSSYIISKQQYDALGRSSQSSNPYRSTDPTSNPIYWTTTQYDALGRVTNVTTPDGAVVNTSYSGAQVLVTDQAGKQRMSQTNALGQLTDVWEITPADGSPVADATKVTVSFPNHAEVTTGFHTSYSYDALNDLTNVTQGQQTRTFAYDSLKRLSSAINPESGTVSYQYDNNGNLMQKTDARGVVTSFDPYDALNRATVRHYSDGTPQVTYTYDTLTNGKGRLSSISSSVSTTSYAGYDALGRVTGSTQTTSGAPSAYVMSYGYDLAGHETSETYPSGRVLTATYDGAGREQSVAGQTSGASKPYASQIAYGAHGAISSMQLGNNLWEHTSFNNRLQPEQIGLGTQSTNASLLQLDYSYGTTNNNGNVQSQIITAPGLALTQSYEYDALNRLHIAKEQNGASWKQTFIYTDQAGQNGQYGNRRLDAANTTQNGVVQNLIENPVISPDNNRIMRQAGEFYHYDAAGNLDCDKYNSLCDQGVKTYVYDGENRQITYNGGAANGGANYIYDGVGKRVKKVYGNTITVFVYDAAGQMVAEYSTDGAQANGTSYLTADNLGTPRVITSQSGAVKARHDYLPFGEELFAGVGGRTAGQGYGGSDSNPFKYAQLRRDDETGLDYAQARYYSNLQGRFTSVDPENAGADPSNPQSWNGYAYAFNNPTIFVDPDGQKVALYDKNGNFVGEVSDEEARNGLFNKDYQRSIGGVVKDNKIYLGGEQIGTYRRTSFDDLDDRANAVIFGNHDTAGLVDRAPVVKQAIGAFVVTTVVGGTIAGAAAAGTSTIAAASGIGARTVVSQALKTLFSQFEKEIAKSGARTMGQRYLAVERVLGKRGLEAVGKYTAEGIEIISKGEITRIANDGTIKVISKATGEILKVIK